MAIKNKIKKIFEQVSRDIKKSSLQKRTYNVDLSRDRVEYNIMRIWKRQGGINVPLCFLLRLFEHEAAENH